MILIVDDNAGIRRTIRTLLADLGHEFLECSDGSEALALYEQHQPAWVLMDVRMQPMDGISATRKLKAAFPRARVIIVSNYDDTQLRTEADGAGAYAYVLKDDLSELLSIITMK